MPINLIQRLLFSFSFILGTMPCVYAQMDVFKALYERAVEAYNTQHYDQSIQLYQQMIAMVPTFAAAYNGMALANQAAGGDDAQTIAYLKTAIGYDPRLTQAYDNLGRIYYARQDMDSAQEYFEKALALDPHLASAQASLAWINLLVRSKPWAAIVYFKQVLKVSQDPRIYFGLGSAYFANNQRVDAMDMITQLHALGANELAARLETSMRTNNQINAQTDTDTSNNAVSATNSTTLVPTPDKPTGIQVHLRGKLSDY